MKHNWRLSPEDKNMLVSQYLTGISAKALGQQYGVSGTAIGGILRRRGIAIRGAGYVSRRYVLNAQAFAVFIPEAAYWFGFLTADGLLSRNKRGCEVRLTLSAVDTHHVEQFKAFLRTSAPLRHVRVKGFPGSNDACSLSIHSETLAQSLLQHGFRQNSLDRCAPLSLQDSADVWRGVVDGDGWIGYFPQNKARLDFVGGQKLLTQFQSYVHTLRPSASLTVRPHKTIWRVGCSGQTALQVIEALYRCCAVGLARKVASAQKIFAVYDAA